jgi:hypothetical protein
VREPVDTSPRRSEPYVKIISSPLFRYKGTRGLGLNVHLQFSLGAIREYNLKRGERVDILWERHNEIWECPIMIIKRNGTQRTLSSNRRSGEAPSALKLSIGTAVLQFKLPLLAHKLPIVDYIDDEIWIDFTPQESNGEQKPKRNKLKEVKSERFGIPFGTEELTVRWGKEYKSALSEIAEGEGLTLNALIMQQLDFYIEDNFPDTWEHLSGLMNRPTEEGGRT